jgi:hypothetical protein
VKTVNDSFTSAFQAKGDIQKSYTDAFLLGERFLTLSPNAPVLRSATDTIPDAVEVTRDGEKYLVSKEDFLKTQATSLIIMSILRSSDPNFQSSLQLIGNTFGRESRDDFLRLLDYLK